MLPRVQDTNPGGANTADVITVLIVDDTTSTLDMLETLLSFEPSVRVVATTTSGGEALGQAKALAPDVILVGLNQPIADAIQATQALVAEVPASPVILMSDQLERDYLRRAMKSGASEFLVKPFSGDELVASIHRVHRLQQAKVTPLLKEAAPEPVASGQIFFLYSGKGGVGKSLIAANLAVAMARQTAARVALVDLDLQFGDIAMLLNLDTSHGITDLIENIDHLDNDFIRQVMVDGPSGLKVLLAPIRPEHADLVMVDHVHRVLGELRNMFDYVVVDSNGNLDEINLDLLDLAHRIVLVTTGSLPAIKDARLALRIFNSLKIPQERVVLILNNPDGYSEFNLENVEANLRFPISLQIPNDTRMAVRSVNRGEPFLTSHPDARISQKIRELVTKLVPQDVSSRAGR